MAWQDRLSPAAYTSPGGTRIEFDFEDVSRQVDKRTSAFNFPEVNGTYIQDNGHTGRRYPLRCIFWGGDHDLAIEAFEALLLEKGPGTLEHPRYGSVDVVPYGTITRRDDLKTSANQAVLEVEFYETTGIVYPSSQTDTLGNISASLDAYNEAMAAEYAARVDIATAGSRADLRARYQNLLNTAEGILRPIAETQADIEATFNTVIDSINQGIDTLISDPLTLAFQTMILIQAPARAAAAISARLEAYGNLAASILGDSNSDNENFHTADLFSSAAVSGCIISAINSEYDNKPAAVSVAAYGLDQLDEITAWRDEMFQTYEMVDPGEAYQALQDSVALTAGYLVDVAFTLAQERRMVLDRARTIIDVTAQLYGVVDEKLNFFINTNSLTGSEIIGLPRGKEIVYYLQSQVG